MSSNIDKNTQIIQYLTQCPQIQDSPLYFNLINAEDGNIQIITRTQDTTFDKPYLDGSIPKKYLFTIVVFKSISDMEVIKQEGYPNENIVDLDDVQQLIDWIQEQEDLHNYPDFGNNCIVDKISTTTDSPNFDGVDSETNPMLAMYSISIMVDYLDMSKVLWNKN